MEMENRPVVAKNQEMGGGRGAVTTEGQQEGAFRMTES